MMSVPPPSTVFPLHELSSPYPFCVCSNHGELEKCPQTGARFMCPEGCICFGYLLSGVTLCENIICSLPELTRLLSLLRRH
jgi:hypothetical protein